MIIDPETAQSMMNNGAEAGQQMMLVDDSDQMVTDHDHAPVEAGNQENMMVMLPNGEQGMVVTPEESSTSLNLLLHQGGTNWCYGATT